VLGKILPFGIVAMGAVIFCIGAGWLLFDLVPVGSTLLLLAVTPIFLLIGLAQGLLISSLARSSVDAVERSVLTMVPQMMLSDFLFPLALMSQPFRTLGEIFPLTHYLRVTRGIYLKGQGFVELWPEIAVLSFFLALFVTLASRTIEKQG
jgi:ABC-2 type transport system permease protein